MNLLNRDLSKPVILKKEESIKDVLSGGSVKFIDAFQHQLKELFFIFNTSYVGQNKKSVFKSKVFKDFIKKNEKNFVYVFLPWNLTLIKTFPKKEYLELKTNRNRDLITKEEQKALSAVRIGVFGMSVGSNIAFVLTQAGISDEIFIADFDLLDTTNLNRIMAGVHQIGERKVDVAAKRIYEDNPFAKIKIMPKGVNKDNLEKLLKAKKLDVIIEEIDEIKMKIETRLLAMKYKIPVVMITDNGDGVVLHIERYDLGYKKIFSKPVSYWKKIIKKEITKEIAGNIIMNDIVGGIDKVDAKMLKSVQKTTNKELVSWSQLGSAAILGGVIVTAALKRLVSGQDKRPYVVEYFNL